MLGAHGDNQKEKTSGDDGGAWMVMSFMKMGDAGAGTNWHLFRGDKVPQVVCNDTLLTSFLDKSHIITKRPRVAV